MFKRKIAIIFLALLLTSIFAVPQTQAEDPEELSFEMWTLDWDIISVDAGDVIEQMLRQIGIEMKAIPLCC
jgi:hypothetical protein